MYQGRDLVGKISSLKNFFRTLGFVFLDCSTSQELLTILVLESMLTYFTGKVLQKVNQTFMHGHLVSDFCQPPS